MAMDVILDDQKISLLLHYLSEFVKWNKAYNLSAVRDPLKMVERHLLDSLALVPLLEKAHDKQRIIDVGTGGGLPGIPLAIVFTDSQITLLDSNGKKTRFLFQVKMALDLNNLTIANTRVETYQPDEGFDIVVSRAFASLQYMVKGTGHLLNQHGRFWAMKGVYPENELRDCEKNAIVESSKSLNIPEQQGERHLLILKPVTSEAVINWDKPEL
ncbi:16S rRNA (guanine(527)-N(7))-methyltransferase [Candidatus Endobugula sertula]|uniref:Ribosomal RNA small subunit methyltransferase G n=1 Tax=Candidatus Endobugula sertula TaxID=62101 RepID=A0A1D2QNM2_9GAMM|nr:16S rRNA (guanine(527)-N(7))-methyltransferase [Candidatus Endobugula sertula]